MDRFPSERIVDRILIQKIFEQGELDENAQKKILIWFNFNNSFHQWIASLFGFLGLIFLLLGVVLFFGAHWEKITDAMKLYGIQSMIVLCWSGAYFFSLDKKIGQILLACASVAVGVFLAVFSQVYPTGSEQYQLFLVWSLMIVPWVMCSRFLPLWMIWVFICCTTINLYFDQAFGMKQNAYLNQTNAKLLFFVMLAFAREWIVASGGKWAEEYHGREFLCILIVGYCFYEIILYVLNVTHLKLITDISKIAIPGIVSLILCWVYSFKLPSYKPVIWVVSSWFVILDAYVIRLMFELFNVKNDLFNVAISFVCTLFFFQSGLHVLKKIKIRMEDSQ